MLLLVRRLRGVISNGGFCRSLEKEEEKIKAMQERALIVRMANNNVDAGELVSSCQAIKDALDTFYVSCSFFFQTTVLLTSVQVGLALLVERNTHDILEVSHLTYDRERCDSIGSCSMSFSIPFLAPMMQLSMLPSTLPTLRVVRAPRVHVLTSLIRLWPGRRRPILRKLHQYIGSPDWPA